MEIIVFLSVGSYLLPAEQSNNKCQKICIIVWIKRYTTKLYFQITKNLLTVNFVYTLYLQQNNYG